MAKGSFLGVKRGKLGDAVGYNVTNSNDKDKQGWRVYQPVVSNPQSDGQMVQRCKMAAVNNLYRALKDVISRGFENHKYGDESRRAWLKVALGQDFSSGPWMVKGSVQPVPIKTVPITVGSLPPVGVGYDTDDEIFYTSIATEITPQTIGDLSRIFIGAGYQAGDQVTIIQGWVPARLAFAWVVKSFYINEGDITTLEDAGIMASPETVGGVSRLQLYLRTRNCDALAIAISRDGDGSHLRSTSYVATNPLTVDAVYYGAPMYEAAKRSYLNTAATRSANWPLQPGEGAESGVYQAETISGVTITLNQVAIVDGYALVTDMENNTYFVQGKATRSLSYNRYLKAKNAEVLNEAWTTTAPSGAADANTLKFGSDNGGGAAGFYTEGLMNFLLANGFTPNVLYANLPNV